MTVEQLFHTHAGEKLQEAAQALSTRYREQDKPYLRTKIDYLAYLAMRMPGTMAAITAVLKRVPTPKAIESLLDLGAGPGTGWLAAKQLLPALKTGTLLETDPEFMALGKTLTDEEPIWQASTLPCVLTPHDLVLMSYSLGEMHSPLSIVQAAWEATQHTLVIIEPGTPQGYALIMQARNHLLELGAHMVAPCPNALACPMVSSDWCHFPARVMRSKLHMQLKGGTLGYEDEKYSYLIVSKQPYLAAGARIVNAPAHHRGHMSLTLCTEGEIKTEIISRKEGDHYKAAKKLAWGDIICDVLRSE